MQIILAENGDVIKPAVLCLQATTTIDNGVLYFSLTNAYPHVKKYAAKIDLPDKTTIHNLMKKFGKYTTVRKLNSGTPKKAWVVPVEVDATAQEEA